MPMRAPIRTISRMLEIWSFFSVLTTGAASSTRVSNRTASENARPTIGSEGMPIGGMNESRGERNENEDGDDFHQHHHVIGFRRLTDTTYEDDRQEHHDDERRPVETEMPSRAVEYVAFQVEESDGKVGGRNPARIRVNAEP